MLVQLPQDPLTTSFLDEFTRCTKWINDALKYAHNSHSAEDVFAMCQAGDAQFWPYHDSVIVTEIVSYPKRRVLRFWLAGGNLTTLLKAEPEIVDWSKQYDCKGVEINGRKGWERVLKSYKPSSITLVKEI